MDENIYYEALGLGANEREVADTAPDASDTGANEREVADPATEDINNDGSFDGDADGTGAASGAPTTGTKETGEDVGTALGQPDTAPTEDADKGERARNAAARRKAELDAAVSAARAEEQRKADEKLTAFIAGTGMTDPQTGERIATVEGYEKFKAAFDTEQLSKNLREGKLTPEDFNRVLSATPAMQQVQAVITRAEAPQAAAEAEKQAAEREKLLERVREDLKEIEKLDPTIKTVEDILKTDTAVQFQEYGARGNPFYDAYYLANRESLTQKAQAAAKQQAMNRTQSKEHLKATDSRGNGAAAVPSAELGMYRLFNPSASEAEIQKHFNNYLKENG